MDNHQIHTTFIPSQRTTFTSHITITGKFSGFLLSPEDCFPQRFDSLKITWYSYTFWFWSASQWWSTFRLLPRHPGRSISTTSVNVKQIITAWLHSDITSEIMCRHFLHPHLTPGKPIFHPGHFSFKIQTGAYHTPAKKPGLPKSDLANFRPISNLNTIGKILERLALSRFFPHISKSPSFSPLQSAYRKFHSTETALLKLTNDILESIDSGKITILTALDMSAAFDTLDHITLLHRLQHTFGLSGYAISWIRSYLTDRSSFVKIDSSSSPSTTILTGVPQGSVLGPLLFVLFISPIANVINSDQSNQNNTVSFHQYADDTQLYIGTNSSTLTSQIASIESCTQRVHDWLLNNGLHLNPSKSEAIAFYNPKSKPLAALAESIGTVSVAGSPIKLQTSIKNLGVYLDSKMSFDKQVSETCKACYFHIRALRHIRASLTTEASKTIAAAIVGSRLDFCNSLLAGTSVSNLTRLQRVQNTLARVVAQKPRFCHITPVLSDLHWLPVRHRISFKIATVTFRVLQSQQPSYLSSLIPRYVPARALRSSSSFSICVPPRKPPWQLPNHFHLLLQIFGMHCQTICLPFQLFLFLEELSNITYSSLLTLTVVQNLVRSNQLNVSHFVIQRQLLPLRRPETPCRPSKSVPSERLRLVEVINFA